MKMLQPKSALLLETVTPQERILLESAHQKTTRWSTISHQFVRFFSKTISASCEGSMGEPNIVLKKDMDVL